LKEGHSVVGQHRWIYGASQDISGDTLPCVASPEVTRLTRRLDAQDDTVRAVSDTVLEIKETVDQHTEALDD
jgi:hypothetical protein